MHISSRDKSRLIGSGGSTIQRIQRASGAWIQIGNTKSDDYHEVAINGTEHQIDIARELIDAELAPVAQLEEDFSGFTLSDHAKERIGQDDRPALDAAREAALDADEVTPAGDGVEVRDRGIIRSIVGRGTDGQLCLITTYFNYQMQLVLLCDSDAASQLLGQREELRRVQRSNLAKKRGSSVSELLAIDLSQQDPQTVPLSSELLDYSAAQTGIRGRGVNPDFDRLYYQPHRERLAALCAKDGLKMISGVELPSPRHGYPTLDVLGCIASTTVTRGDSRLRTVWKTLQARALVEAGILLNDDLYDDCVATVQDVGGIPTFFEGGMSTVRRRCVIYLTLRLPANVSMRMVRCSSQTHPNVPPNGLFLQGGHRVLSIALHEVSHPLGGGGGGGGGAGGGAGGGGEGGGGRAWGSGGGSEVTEDIVNSMAPPRNRRQLSDEGQRQFVAATRVATMPLQSDRSTRRDWRRDSRSSGHSKGIARDDRGKGFARDDRGKGIAQDDRGKGFARDDRGKGFARDDRGKGFARDDRGKGIQHDDSGKGIQHDDSGKGV
jgi:hypothetical protein